MDENEIKRNENAETLRRICLEIDKVPEGSADYWRLRDEYDRVYRESIK